MPTSRSSSAARRRGGAGAGVVVHGDRRLLREGLTELLCAAGLPASSVEHPGELPEACARRAAGAALVELAGDPALLSGVIDELATAGVRVVGVRAPGGRRPELEGRFPILERTATAAQLTEALRSGGAVPVGPPARPLMPGPLTSRELQVLALIGTGATCVEIAKRLGISTKTVESRRQQVFAKLGVQSQAQAVAAALRAGLLGSERPAASVAVPGSRRPARPAAGYGRPGFAVRRLRPGVPTVVVAHAERWLAPLLGEVLGGEGELVGETESGETAVRLSEVYRPDVVLVGEVFSDGLVDGFLGRLLKTGARVVVLAEPLELARMIALVEPGVTGIVDPTLSPAELAGTVLTVAGGGAVLPPQLAAAIAAEWRMARRSNGVVSSTRQLTAREVEVLGAMVDGMATKAIAHLLGVSSKTVENHKTRIFAKLGVRTQAEAVSFVLDGPYSHELVQVRTGGPAGAR